jgi:DNA-binding CsgD family transcriptional regulator
MKPLTGHTAPRSTAGAPDAGCPAPRHHTATAYINGGCRCADAKELARLYRKRLRYGLPTGRGFRDATGTRRRIQALVALGWTQNQLGQRLGASRSVVSQLARGRTYPQVEHATAERVTLLYEHLSGTPGPSEQARARARRAGYAPPCAWDEHTIDDPAAGPDYGPTQCPPGYVDHIGVERGRLGDLPAAGLRRDERAAAITVLTSGGHSARAIAARLGISERSITRTRRATRSAA